VNSDLTTESRIRSATRWAGVAHLPAALVLLLDAAVVWNAQHYVDYETSLLPWLVGRGWRLYADIVDQHPPLFTGLLSLAGGGDPGLPLRVAIIGLHFLTLGLVYRVAARLAGAGGGLVALVLAAVWLMPFEAMHLWYDGALGLVYLGIAYCALRAVGRTPVTGLEGSGGGWGFLAGLLLGVGVLVKQHAIVALPFVLLSIWPGKQGRPVRRVALFCGGFASPLLAALALFTWHGTLDRAWYWLVEYSLAGGYSYASALPPEPGEWALLAALYLPLAGFAGAIKGRQVATYPALWLTISGLAVAASATIWPRYGRFHLQGAIPILAVAGGVGAAWLWREWRLGLVGRGRTMAVVAGLMLVAISGMVGAGEWARTLFTQAQSGPPQAPYAATLGPLRAWVDAHAVAAAPLFLYQLDPLLYRVLEREPPRPFVPQLPWIVSSSTSESDLWAGVERANPPVALAPAEWWDGFGSNPLAVREGWLHRTYREGGRFTLISYQGAHPVSVVGLLRDDGQGR
jgi:hypothetical protein